MHDEVGPSDRWLIDGDCSKCRRQKHCSKPCKKCKVRSQMLITGAVLNAMPPVFTEILSKTKF